MGKKSKANDRARLLAEAKAREKEKRRRQQAAGGRSGGRGVAKPDRLQQLLALRKQRAAAASAQGRGADGETDVAEGGRVKRPQRGMYAIGREQRVLEVGAGNFSFAVALARDQLGGAASGMVATSFDSLGEIEHKYAEATEVVAALRRAGATVLHGVDATRMRRTLKSAAKAVPADEKPQLSPLGPFDHVVFLFPHHGAGIKSEDHSVQRSRELLLAFFSSVPEVLAPGGQVHVTVKTGMPYEKVRRWGRAPIALRARAAHAEFHSDASLASRTWRTRMPRRTRVLGQWGVAGLARSTGLDLLCAERFAPEAWPGYRHRRTLGFLDGLSDDSNKEIAGGARTYTFAAAS